MTFFGRGSGPSVGRSSGNSWLRTPVAQARCGVLGARLFPYFKARSDCGTLAHAQDLGSYAVYLSSLMMAAVMAFSLAGAALALPHPARLAEIPTAYAKKGHEVKWKSGGCKYKYKADKKGFKEEYKCK